MAEVKRLGIYSDEAEEIQLRVGDILVVYYTIQSF